MPAIHLFNFPIPLNKSYANAYWLRVCQKELMDGKG